MGPVIAVSYALAIITCKSHRSRDVYLNIMARHVCRSRRLHILCDSRALLAIPFPWFVRPTRGTRGNLWILFLYAGERERERDSAVIIRERRSIQRYEVDGIFSSLISIFAYTKRCHCRLFSCYCTRLIFPSYHLSRCQNDTIIIIEKDIKAKFVEQS